MEAWERPVTESFLRLLININDHDAGIYSCPPAHLKTVIETAELKTVPESLYAESEVFFG